MYTLNLVANFFLIGVNTIVLDVDSLAFEGFYKPDILLWLPQTFIEGIVQIESSNML